ncbi:hypothetical protein [Streptomyces lincolnensis]|nr:hypothetical protein [Streptomyces lincolnensis]
MLQRPDQICQYTGALQENFLTICNLDRARLPPQQQLPPAELT